MRILALRRRPDRSTQDPLIDATYSTSMIGEMLGQCDYVAVAVPLTLETRQMIAAEQIAAMKPSAVINVGRGRVLDEAALVRALDSGKIRGAALDVFGTEPLPAGHPLYHLGNVLLSPHSADHTPGWLERGMECFLDNSRTFPERRTAPESGRQASRLLTSLPQNQFLAAMPLEANLCRRAPGLT